MGLSGHQDQIRPGFKGQDGGFGAAVVLADGLHDQGIGHHQAGELQLLAQQTGQDGLREGGRLRVVQGRQAQVGGHHRGHPRGNRPLKGRQLDLIEAFAVVGQFGQLQVRIRAGVAVAGEVFGAGQHALGLAALDEGRREGPGALGGLPPGAHVDHGVGRVVVDVADRTQHPVQPQQPRLPAGAAAVALSQGLRLLGIACMQGPQREGRRQPGSPLKALADPLFHVGAEQQGLARPALELLAAQTQFLSAAPQQDHAAHSLLEEGPQLRVAQFPAGVAALMVPGMAAAPHHQQAGELPPELRSLHPPVGLCLREPRRALGAAPRAGSADRARRCPSRCRGPAGRSPQGCGACSAGGRAPL